MSNLQMQGLSNYPVSFLAFTNNINIGNYLKLNIILHFQQALAVQAKKSRTQCPAF